MNFEKLGVNLANSEPGLTPPWFQVCSFELYSLTIFGIGEGRPFIFRVLTDTQKYQCMHYPRNGCVQGHMTVLNFGT